MDLNKDVQVKGYGILSREQVQKKIASYLRSALTAVDLGNFNGADWLIRGNGVLNALLDAECQEIRLACQEQDCPDADNPESPTNIMIDELIN